MRFLSNIKSSNTSPSLVGDKFYLFSEKADMFIMQVSDKYQEISKSSLGEECFESPALVNGRIYSRVTLI